MLASIGEYSEYNYLEEILEDTIGFKVDDDLNIKYQTIKDYNLDKYEYNYHSSKKMIKSILINSYNYIKNRWISYKLLEYIFWYKSTNLFI